jgi:hypothetical protein
MAGLGQDLKVDGEYYADALTVPQNDSTNSSSVKTMQGAQNGALQVKVVVNTDIVLADTKVMSIKVQDSADDTTFADVATIYTVTADGETTVSADTVLALFALPTDTGKYTRIVVTTDDAAVTGKVDAYPQYLPR